MGALIRNTWAALPVNATAPARGKVGLSMSNCTGSLAIIVLIFRYTFTRGILSTLLSHFTFNPSEIVEQRGQQQSYKGA